MNQLAIFLPLPGLHESGGVVGAEKKERAADDLRMLNKNVK